jgi:hypothetical protein
VAAGIIYHPQTLAIFCYKVVLPNYLQFGITLLGALSTIFFSSSTGLKFCIKPNKGAKLLGMAKFLAWQLRASNQTQF